MTLDELIKRNAHRTIDPKAIPFLDEFLTSVYEGSKAAKKVDMSLFIENQMDCTFSMYDGTEWYNGKLKEIKINDHGDTWYIAENGYGYKYCEPRYNVWNYDQRGWDYSVVPWESFDMETVELDDDTVCGVKVTKLSTGWTI